jgi:hypothetical protein
MKGNSWLHPIKLKSLHNIFVALLGCHCFALTAGTSLHLIKLNQLSRLRYSQLCPSLVIRLFAEESNNANINFLYIILICNPFLLSVSLSVMNTY